MNNKSTKKKVHNLILSSMFLAIGMILPFFIGQIPAIGKMLCPMHIPVFLCGLICGWEYGLAVGFILPLLRMALWGMPALYNAIAMAFELAVYGSLSGLLFSHSHWQCVWALYKSMFVAMIAGRAVWGVVSVILSGVTGVAFTWKLFLAGAFLNAIPGIILQLVFIPAVMVALDKAGFVKFHREMPASFIT